MKKKMSFEDGVDYYLDGEKVIMTENFHMKRGVCCGNICRHCCFYPQFIKGNTILRENLNKKEK